MAKFALIVLLSVLSLESICQESRRLDSISSIKSVIQKGNQVTSKSVGALGSPSKYWYSFAYLLSVCTDDELTQMTYDSIPAVRLYSFIALVHKKHSGLSTVRERLLLDFERISTYTGDVIDNISVSECVTKISLWYDVRDVIRTVVAIQKEPGYRSKLYVDIINDRLISPR